MTRLEPADQLAALMRSQMAGLRKAASAKRPAAGAARAGAARPQGDLAALAAQRIRGIAPDDPAREHKAVRAFLECVVLSELGAGLVSDPAFVRLIDHVQQQLQADPQLAQATAQAAQALLASAQGQGGPP